MVVVVAVLEIEAGRGLKAGPGREEVEEPEVEGGRGESGVGLVSKSSMARDWRRDWGMVETPQEVKVASGQETMPNS